MTFLLFLFLSFFFNEEVNLNLNQNPKLGLRQALSVNKMGPSPKNLMITLNLELNTKKMETAYENQTLSVPVSPNFALNEFLKLSATFFYLELKCYNWILIY